MNKRRDLNEDSNQENTNNTDKPENSDNTSNNLNPFLHNKCSHLEIENGFAQYFKNLVLNDFNDKSDDKDIIEENELEEAIKLLKTNPGKQLKIQIKVSE